MVSLYCISHARPIGFGKNPEVILLKNPYFWDEAQYCKFTASQAGDSEEGDELQKREELKRFAKLEKIPAANLQIS